MQFIGLSLTGEWTDSW